MRSTATPTASRALSLPARYLDAQPRPAPPQETPLASRRLNLTAIDNCVSGISAQRSSHRQLQSKMLISEGPRHPRQINFHLLLAETDTAAAHAAYQASATDERCKITPPIPLFECYRRAPKTSSSKSPPAKANITETHGPNALLPQRWRYAARGPCRGAAPTSQERETTCIVCRHKPDSPGRVDR
jgi:hypothetical protein